MIKSFASNVLHDVPSGLKLQANEPIWKTIWIEFFGFPQQPVNY